MVAKRKELYRVVLNEKIKKICGHGVDLFDAGHVIGQ